MKKIIIRYVVAFIAWIIISLRWFLKFKNPIVGVIWMIAGLIALIFSLVREIKNNRDNFDGMG